MRNDYEDQNPLQFIGRIARACSPPPQRAKVKGCPRVVHGLRAAQPDEGDAPTSPQSGQRWATGGQPSARVSGVSLCSCCCVCAARPNRCAVQADAGESAANCAARLNACGVEADAVDSAATGRRPRRAAELRSSGRDGSVRQDRRTSPLRPRHDRQTEPTLSHSHRRHVACMPLRSSVASSLVAAAHGAQATRRLHRPSMAVSVEHRAPIQHARLLPRDCVHPLRACTKPCSAGAQRVQEAAHPARLPLRSTCASPIPVSRGSSALRITTVARAHGAIGGPWT